MSQKIDQTNNAHDESFSRIQDNSVTHKDNVKETDRNPDVKAQVVKKKPFAERMKTHRFFLVRAVYYIFYSVWAIVMGIGMLIAWLIAMLFI